MPEPRHLDTYLIGSIVKYCSLGTSTRDAAHSPGTCFSGRILLASKHSRNSGAGAREYASGYN